MDTPQLEQNSNQSNWYFTGYHTERLCIPAHFTPETGMSGPNPIANHLSSNNEKSDERGTLGNVANT